ncbi:MAG: biotin/lipoyl-containing protein, partial [Gaiellaceae bacterium]
GVDREHARRRMLRALDEFEIAGPTTLLGFHRALLAHPCFVAGKTCHGLVESEQLAKQAEKLSHKTTVASVSDGHARELVREVEVDGRRFTVKLLEAEPPWLELARRHADRERRGYGGSDAAVVSPMQGTVLKVEVADGDEVVAGQVLCIVEAMKMENEISAHRGGTVSGLAVAPGQSVRTGDTICLVVGDPGSAR